MSSTQNELIAPPYLSPSSIGTFRQCSLKFRYNKIDLIPDKPTEATMLGNFVHDTLEVFYKFDPEERTIFLAKKLANDQWNNMGWADRVGTLIFKEDKLREFRWRSWWCIENLWQVENPNLITPVGIEHELNGKINGVQMKGFIDRYSVDDNAVIISDYKTGKTPSAKYVDDKFFQLIIYSSLLIDEIKENFILEPSSKLELLYLKDGKKFEKNVSAEDVLEMSTIVQETKDSIDEKCLNHSFEPQTSILCNWCAYKTICPAWVRS